MSSIKIPGLGKAKGMQQRGPLPTGEYLLECTKVERVSNETNGVKTGITFTVTAKVLGADKLPSGVSAKTVVERSFTDFIFVMSPKHPKYSNVASNGTQIGMIGVNTLKSWLESCGVPIIKDAFDEQKAVGKWFEVRLGTRSYEDREGKTREGNQVYEYRPYTSEEESEEEEELEGEIETEEIEDAEVVETEEDDDIDFDEDIVE